MFYPFHSMVSCKQLELSHVYVTEKVIFIMHWALSQLTSRDASPKLISCSVITLKLIIPSSIQSRTDIAQTNVTSLLKNESEFCTLTAAVCHRHHRLCSFQIPGYWNKAMGKSVGVPANIILKSIRKVKVVRNRTTRPSLSRSQVRPATRNTATRNIYSAGLNLDPTNRSMTRRCMPSSKACRKSATRSSIRSSSSSRTRTDA